MLHIVCVPATACSCQVNKYDETNDNDNEDNNGDNEDVDDDADDNECSDADDNNVVVVSVIVVVVIVVDSIVVAVVVFVVVFYVIFRSDHHRRCWQRHDECPNWQQHSNDEFARERRNDNSDGSHIVDCNW